MFKNCKKVKPIIAAKMITVDESKIDKDTALSRLSDLLKLDKSSIIDMPSLEARVSALEEAVTDIILTQMEV